LRTGFLTVALPRAGFVTRFFPIFRADFLAFPLIACLVAPLGRVFVLERFDLVAAVRFVRFAIANPLICRARSGRRNDKISFTPLSTSAQLGYWFAMITTDANELVSEVYDRMPLILAPGDCARWLGEEADPCDLMRPHSADLMRMWPISTRVKQLVTDDPSILEPVELDAA
jgi:hypothetical protein